MNWTRTLTRDDILANIEAYKDDPDFVAMRDTYLDDGVGNFDAAFVKVLLEAGAGPDVVRPWGDSLQHDLVHDYQNSRSTQGDRILAVLELLLANGADPNRVGSGNWRAIDLAISWKLEAVVSLFVRYGADPVQREYM